MFFCNILLLNSFASFPLTNVAIANPLATVLSFRQVTTILRSTTFERKHLGARAFGRKDNGARNTFASKRIF